MGVVPMSFVILLFWSSRKAGNVCSTLFCFQLDTLNDVPGMRCWCLSLLVW